MKSIAAIVACGALLLLGGCDFGQAPIAAEAGDGSSADSQLGAGPDAGDSDASGPDALEPTDAALAAPDGDATAIAVPDGTVDATVDATGVDESAPADSAVVDSTVADATPAVVDAAAKDVTAADVGGCPGSAIGATWPPVTIVNGCAMPVPSVTPACASTTCPSGATCVGSGWCVPSQITQAPGTTVGVSAAGIAVTAAGHWAVTHAEGLPLNDHLLISVGQIAGLTLGAPLLVNDLDGDRHGMAVPVPLLDGSWLVVWLRTKEAVNQPIAILARRVSADGSQLLGPAWQVNTTVLGDGAYSPGAHWGPVVERTQDGHVLVTWAGSLPLTTPWGVYGRMLAPDGTAAGGEFLIAGAAATANAGRPSLARLSSDRIVAAWPQMAGGKNLATRVMVRQVTDGSTVSLGPAVQVSPGTANVESLPAIAAFGDHDVVVAWQATGSKTPFGKTQVFAQTWSLCDKPAATGAVVLLGANPGTQGVANTRAITLVGGRVLVLWQVYATPGADEVRARRYNPAEGVWDCDVENLAGPVAAPETGWREQPFAAALPGGGFVAAWNAGVTPSALTTIKVRAWPW